MQRWTNKVRKELKEEIIYSLENAVARKQIPNPRFKRKPEEIKMLYTLNFIGELLELHNAIRKHKYEVCKVKKLYESFFEMYEENYKDTVIDELADCAIMLFSWASYFGGDLNPIHYKFKSTATVKAFKLSTIIENLIHTVTREPFYVRDFEGTKFYGYKYVHLLEVIFWIAEKLGYDLIHVIKLKTKFNCIRAQKAIDKDNESLTKLYGKYIKPENRPEGV